MTLVVADDRSAEPRTHVLILGVGGYRHLKGGEDERDTLLHNVGLLRQLTSPPRSALAFSDWVSTNATRLRVPLGSVEMLLSIADEDDLATPAGVALGASRPLIEAAYESWRDRCDRNEGNVAVFYFCGHGLEKSEQYLLAEDFGANNLNPWVGAFGFDSTRLAFHGCRARTQCFFIDACRKLTSRMLTKEPQATGLELFDHAVPECEHNLTVKAAAKNEEAFGPPKEVSYFTQALLRALSGAAARQNDTGWVVETGGISAHINEILEMVGKSEAGESRCSCTTTGSAALVDVDLPLVSVVLGCSPDAANPIAKFSWRAIGDAASDLERLGGPWRFDAAPGMYRAAADFDDPQFQSAEAQVLAIPPRAARNLRCQP